MKIEAWSGSGRLVAPKPVVGSILGGPRAIFEANMALSWVPKSKQIDAKIDQKIDACHDRFLIGFGWILGT